VTLDLEGLPGESGLFAGVANLYGYARHGAVHLRKQVDRYGPVYRHMAGSTPIVCIANADWLGRAARNEDRVWSAATAYDTLFRQIDPTSNTLDSPASMDFERHREVRKLLQPAFGTAAIADYAATVTEMCGRAAEEWIECGHGAFKPAVRRLLASVAARIFLGVDDHEEARMLDEALADAWRGLTAVYRDPRLSGTWRRAMRGHRTLREALRRRVGERRSKGGTDLFGRLCQVAEGHDRSSS
jgi:cytochrome P450